jgi:peptidyl-prolyl cis-trans isomerase SurA
MNRGLLFLVLLPAFAFRMQAQTLLTYGNNKVDIKEFSRAYNKLYPGPVTNKEKTVREYLDLFINSRLKVQEAIERRYDTLSSFIDEVSTLRQQIIENYMTDHESVNILAEEAFDRSRKDIQAAHVFIPYKNENGVSDSALSKLKIREAHMELMAGKNFEAVAEKYSADPAVKQNRGNLGFITVFSLPYEFENIIYSLSAGKFSSPYKSSFGYHIFKNSSERKAVGKMKASQILLTFPPGSDETAKKQTAKLADSLYQRLLKGDDFAKLAVLFSNDYVTAASGGQLPEFGVGAYNPDFEKIVFALPANGAISRPFLTSYGYHIVKRISLTPPAAVKNKKSLEELKVQLEKDPRIDMAREMLYKKIIAKAGLKEAEVSKTDLQAFADGILDNKMTQRMLTVNRETLLFMLGSQPKNAGELMDYAQANRWTANGMQKSLEQIISEFKQQTAFDYYRNHMEEYNEDFRLQMNDMRTGNLFFDIMMREVWSKAQSDTAGQKDYFEHNKKKYIWKNSADAVVFYCADENTAQQLRMAVSGNPSGWKNMLQQYSDRTLYDSSRIESSKIPGIKKLTPKAGLITPVEKNKDENSASFAYITKIYPLPAAKTFNDAKNDVVADYQNELDTRWIAELRKKYPVKVDEAVLRSMLK